MGRRAAQPNERGFSLVETLVALVLFSLISATLGDFLVGQIRAAARNNRYTMAYSIGAEELERMRAQPFRELTSGGSEQSHDGVLFSVETEVWDDRPAPNMKQITVDVAWNEPGEGSQHVYVHTIYAGVRR